MYLKGGRPRETSGDHIGPFPRTEFIPVYGIEICTHPARTPKATLVSGITCVVISASGVLLYGCVGLASLLNGGNFFDYNVLSEDPISGQHLGMFLIELGVGCTVASTMMIIFFNFAGRREMQHNNNQESSSC